MCISEEISYLTLTIGTLVNCFIIYSLINNKKYELIPIIFLWQYALLMQIPDGLAWNKIKKGENTEFAGKLAAFLNLTQPIVTFILILIITKNYKMLIPSAIVLVMYIINIYQNLSKFNYNVTPGKNCSSLNYSWWDHLNTIFYMIFFPLVFLAISNLNIIVINTLIFFITIGISIAINYNCNPGSFWCWSVASAGLANYVLI